MYGTWCMATMYGNWCNWCNWCTVRSKYLQLVRSKYLQLIDVALCLLCAVIVDEGYDKLEPKKGETEALAAGEGKREKLATDITAVVLPDRPLVGEDTIAWSSHTHTRTHTAQLSSAREISTCTLNSMSRRWTLIMIKFQLPRQHSELKQSLTHYVSNRSRFLKVDPFIIIAPFYHQLSVHVAVYIVDNNVCNNVCMQNPQIVFARILYTVPLPTYIYYIHMCMCIYRK